MNYKTLFIGSAVLTLISLLTASKELAAAGILLLWMGLASLKGYIKLG